MAKSNIITATKELVKELKGDQREKHLLLTMGSFILSSGEREFRTPAM